MRVAATLAFQLPPPVAPPLRAAASTRPAAGLGVSAIFCGYFALSAIVGIAVTSALEERGRQLGNTDGVMTLQACSPGACSSPLRCLLLPRHFALFSASFPPLCSGSSVTLLPELHRSPAIHHLHGSHAFQVFFWTAGFAFGGVLAVVASGGGASAARQRIVMALAGLLNAIYAIGTMVVRAARRRAAEEPEL